MISIHLEGNMLHKYAQLLNCTLLSMSFLYLGIPIGANPRREVTWRPILHKFTKKFASWKYRHLSLADFYGAQYIEGKRKVAWVSWKNICRPKSQVGLGIKDIITFNEALLAKWKWNLFHHRDNLWAKVLKSKYDDDYNIKSSSIWRRDLRKAGGGNNQLNWFDKMRE
uniref:Uncharacterized protein n=1 Tax=Cajanus cajan TaxID=3821 RepID=A0A151T994_CAJCA|nr:hypothetical protein KK1_018190 [Cajanus cajan]